MQAKPQAQAGLARRGAVLLEVLLALALFVFAAAVITSSLNSGVERVTRLRVQLHALDLAVTVMSELKLGILPLATAGPEPFDAPFDQWTWQVEATPYTFTDSSVDDSEAVSTLQLVTVTVKNDQNTGFQQLTEILGPPPARGGLGSLSGASAGGTGLAPTTANDTSGP